MRRRHTPAVTDALGRQAFSSARSQHTISMPLANRAALPRKQPAIEISDRRCAFRNCASANCLIYPRHYYIVRPIGTECGGVRWSLKFPLISDGSRPDAVQRRRSAPGMSASLRVSRPSKTNEEIPPVRRSRCHDVDCDLPEEINCPRLFTWDVARLVRREI